MRIPHWATSQHDARSGTSDRAEMLIVWIRCLDSVARTRARCTALVAPGSCTLRNGVTVVSFARRARRGDIIDDHGDVPHAGDK